MTSVDGKGVVVEKGASAHRAFLADVSWREPEFVIHESRCVAPRAAPAGRPGEEAHPSKDAPVELSTLKLAGKGLQRIGQKDSFRRDVIRKAAIFVWWSAADAAT